MALSNFAKNTKSWKSSLQLRIGRASFEVNGDYNTITHKGWWKRLLFFYSSQPPMSLSWHLYLKVKLPKFCLGIKLTTACKLAGRKCCEVGGCGKRLGYRVQARFWNCVLKLRGHRDSCEGVGGLLSRPSVSSSSSSNEILNITTVATEKKKKKMWISVPKLKSSLSTLPQKHASGATIVQSLGVVMTLIVLAQLTAAGAMPLLPVFLAAIVVSLAGFPSTFFPSCFKGVGGGYLSGSNLKTSWQEIIGMAGLYFVSQMIWSAFVPWAHPSALPGLLFAAVETALLNQGNLDKFPPNIVRTLGGLSGWTATLFFMWAPIAQLYSDFINRSNVKGVSVSTVLFALMSNGLLISRALFRSDFMWFTGALWGCMLQGWGLFLRMYWYKATNGGVFWTATIFLVSWLGGCFRQQKICYHLWIQKIQEV